MLDSSSWPKRFQYSSLRLFSASSASLRGEYPTIGYFWDTPHAETQRTQRKAAERSFGLILFHTNLEEFRPEFTRNEEPVVFSIICDAVQYIDRLLSILGLEKAAEIDPGNHSP